MSARREPDPQSIVDWCARQGPRLVAITELPPQSWLAEMADPAVIE